MLFHVGKVQLDRPTPELVQCLGLIRTHPSNKFLKKLFLNHACDLSTSRATCRAFLGTWTRPAMFRRAYEEQSLNLMTESLLKNSTTVIQPMTFGTLVCLCIFEPSEFGLWDVCRRFAFVLRTHRGVIVLVVGSVKRNVLTLAELQTAYRYVSGICQQDFRYASHEIRSELHELRDRAEITRHGDDVVGQNKR